MTYNYITEIFLVICHGFRIAADASARPLLLLPVLGRSRRRVRRRPSPRQREHSNSKNIQPINWPFL